MLRISPLTFIILPFCLIVGCTGTRPTNLGLKDGGLAPCPSTPNCASSQSADKEHAIEPLKYSGPATEAMARLAKIIRGIPRARVVSETDSYLYAEFTSLVFRFVDDVEFAIDEHAGVIHVRSASRLGKSDLGVNRKRVERIRELWKDHDRS